jgi:flagellar biosynthetic protein FliO
MGKLAIRAFFSLILVVLLLFALMFGLRWLQRHATPGGSQTGPTMQVCGALSLGPKKTLQIVQVGKQLLVLGVTDTSISLVTEITDADEIKELEKIPPKNRLASKPFSEYLARFKSK